jgi:glycosyltransferase involved in cell wall biosynthesis
MVQSITIIMKILYISCEIPQFPGGSGGQTRQFNMLKMLSERHEVDLICPRIKDELLDSLKQVCNKVIMPERAIEKKMVPKWTLWFLLKIKNGLDLLMSLISGHPDYVQRTYWHRIFMVPIIKRELMTGAYDIIQFEHTNIAHWLESIRVSIPKVIVAHNVKSILYKRYWENARGFQRRFLYREYSRFLQFERSHLNKYDCVVAMSEIDRDLIKQLNGENISVAVVPNGVDIDYYLPQTQTTACPAELVFVGTMNYPPNDEAALYFCNNIFPLIMERNPSVTFSIVGKDPTVEVLRLARRKNIIVTGFVSDSRPYMAAASVVVVPLLSGSGTRMKIFEAMAMGKAVVSTSIGAEGIEYNDGKDILIADTDQIFTEKVLYLLSDRDAALEIGKNARCLVEQKYAWKILSDKMDYAYSYAITNASNQNFKS